MTAPSAAPTDTEKENATMSAASSSSHPHRALTASALRQHTLASSPSKSRARSETTDTDVTLNSLATNSTTTTTTTLAAGAPAKTAAVTTAVAVPTWDAFVRQGARLKTLLGEALLREPTAKKRTRHEEKDDNNNNETRSVRPRTNNQSSNSSSNTSMLALLQEKAAENLRLKRELKDVQSEASILQATNVALREEVASTQSRLERTTTSLRMASENAAKDRANAEAAEAMAASLAQTLQSLQTVVDETKSATYLLHQEQQQLAKASSAAETKLLQKEAELVRAQVELKSLQKNQTTFDLKASQWKHEKEALESQMEHMQHELQELRKQALERQAVEHARKVRAHKVEEDLREVQMLLQEATAGQELSTQTQADMQETISTLHSANKQLNSQLSMQQEASRKETSRLNEALTKAEKEVQTLRIQNEAVDEELERLRLDKAAVDKQNAQLKSKTTTLELRLKESASATTTTTPLDDFTGSMVTPSEANRLSMGRTYTLPPLQSATTSSMSASDSNTNSAPASSTCCLCFKTSFGLMKSCQCGNKDCGKRAHLTCVHRIQPSVSVSHPGTPASPLPLVLCTSVQSAIYKEGAPNNMTTEAGME